MSYILEYIFYLAAFLFIYNYFIYPIVIITWVKLFKLNDQVNILPDGDTPTVSFIIAAFNEGLVIEDKIKNTLLLDYPKDKLQIIVVSDGSSDSTENIVRTFESKGVVSLHEVEKNGKSSALNRGVEISTGEIIVFSDANNDFSSNAIRELVKHFSVKNIGAVTGAKHIYTNTDRQAATGDGLYWKYESKIKAAESAIGSITGAEGEIFAVRKFLFNPIDKIKINDDAAITFDVVKAGYRVLYEKNAKAFEQASIDLVDDFNVKVRMTAGGYQTLSFEKRYLFLSFRWFSFSFISHKVLRWLAPHLLLVIYVLPLLLLERIEMQVYFFLQTVFYVIALYGWAMRKKAMSKLTYIIMYFSVMNVALFFGFLRYFSNQTDSIWKKAKR